MKNHPLLYERAPFHLPWLSCFFLALLLFISGMIEWVQEIRAGARPALVSGSDRRATPRAGSAAQRPTSRGIVRQPELAPRAIEEEDPGRPARLAGQ